MNPTPRSRLGRYLAETGARKFRYRFQFGQKVGPEKLVIVVGPESFEAYNRHVVRGNPNLIEQVNGPSVLLNPGMAVPSYAIHFWFRWLNLVYDYAGEPGFRSNPWRFSQGKTNAVMMLSDSETSRWADYLDLTGDPKTPFRYPQNIEGFNYPRDAYVGLGNCTGFFFHAPVGDEQSSSVTSCGKLDRFGADIGPEARTATLKDYEVPAAFADRAAQFKRVWNPKLNARLLDVLGFPVEEGHHTGGSDVAGGLLSVSSNDRVPFVVYYHEDHRVFSPSPIPRYQWTEVGGAGVDLAIGANNVPYLLGKNDRGEGMRRLYRFEKGGWVDLGVNGKRVSVDGLGRPWLVGEKNRVKFFRYNKTWFGLHGVAHDIGVGGESYFEVSTEPESGGFAIQQFLGDKEGETWRRMPGGAVKIAVNQNGVPLVVNKTGFVYAWHKEEWRQWGYGTADDIGISQGEDGKVWIVTQTPYPGGKQLAFWNGRGWTGIDRGARVVAPAPDGSIWIIDEDLKIFRGVRE